MINWSSPQAAAAAPAACIPDPVKLAAQAPPVLIERLPWDFTTTFPQPTDEAIDSTQPAPELHWGVRRYAEAARQVDGRPPPRR
jgi:hypothetical protein